MDIGNALRRAGRDDITTRSVIANTIKKMYSETSGRDISIDSVQVRGKKVFVKTGNMLVNSELQLMSGDIQKASLEKLRSMHIRIPADTQFRFI